uniref:Uncharacterized protein n=1 Tax=Anguilla anguilla TaxID=7936 RepID=A0A0E9XPQ2_ANGAN
MKHHKSIAQNHLTGSVHFEQGTPSISAFPDDKRSTRALPQHLCSQ